MAYCFVLFVLVSVDHGKCFTTLSLSNARAGVCIGGLVCREKALPAAVEELSMPCRHGDVELLFPL